MAALVGDDPQAGHDEAGSERVDCPEREAGKGIEVGAGQAEVLGVDERVGERC